MAAAQAAYSLLSDDTDAGSGESFLGDSQNVVGAAEQQIVAETNAGDKSAPAKQPFKGAAEAKGAAAAASAAGATAGSATRAAEGSNAAAAASGVDAKAGATTASRSARRPRLWGVKKAGATLAAVVREDVGRVFSTYLLVSVFESAVLLASTVFVTLPLTIPRLLNVQLAVPLAALEGPQGREAMRVSKDRMLGYRRTAAAMLGLVFVLQKALPPVSALLISSLPPNVIVQVPEAVVLVLLAGQVLLFGASQLKGLTALLIYNHTAKQAAAPAAA